MALNRMIAWLKINRRILMNIFLLFVIKASGLITISFTVMICQTTNFKESIE